MLIQRLMTWLVLITLVILGICKLPPVGFSIVMTIFWAIAAWEWTALLKIEPYIERFLLVAIILLFSVAAYFYFPWMTLLAGSLAWLGALFLVLKFPEIPKFYQQSRLVKLGLGLLYLTPCWVGLNVIRGDGKGVVYIFVMFSVVWMVDTLGYVIGKPFGKHKLIYRLSPGKSIEGVLGGIATTMLLLGIGMFYFKLPLKPQIVTLVLIFWVACFSVVGDLFESLLKRQAGVKDSGCILPGHGGVLDRMDSTLASVPLFALVLPWIST